MSDVKSPKMMVNKNFMSCENKKKVSYKNSKHGTVQKMYIKYKKENWLNDFLMILSRTIAFCMLLLGCGKKCFHVHILIITFCLCFPFFTYKSLRKTLMIHQNFVFAHTHQITHSIIFHTTCYLVKKNNFSHQHRLIVIHLYFHNIL